MKKIFIGLTLIFVVISFLSVKFLDRSNIGIFKYQSYSFIYDKRKLEIYVNGEKYSGQENFQFVKLVLKEMDNAQVLISFFDNPRYNSNTDSVIIANLKDVYTENTSCNIEFSNLRTLYFPCPEKIQEYKQSVIDQPKYGFTFYDIIDQSDYVHRIAEIPIFDKKFSQISVAFYEIDEFINYKSEIFSIIDKLLNMKQDTKIHL